MVSETCERVIWKFTLYPQTGAGALPRGAKVLSAGAQGHDVVAWAECDPHAPHVARDLYAFPTGVPLPDWTGTARFVSTVQLPGGLFFHVYDGGEVDA